MTTRENTSNSGLWMEVLQGSVLANPRVRRNYRFALFLAFLAALSIYSSNSADRRVMRIQQLKDRHKAVNSAFVTTRSHLMRESLEQRVLERVRPMGLERPANPPFTMSHTAP